jgi:hypothetical protein
MTDSELLAAQHRVIVNMGGCSCNLAWKHTDGQPLCPKCLIIAEYERHQSTALMCVHGIGLGYDCIMCPRGIAQVWMPA